MTKGLQRIVYRSDSAISHDDEAGLREIFRQSVPNNRRDQITGALALPDGKFVQVIEGPTGAVEALMKRISADPRHSNLVILGDWPISARLFSRWAMAHPNTTPLDQQTFRIITQDGSGAQVAGLMMRLVENREAPMF